MSSRPLVITDISDPALDPYFRMTEHQLRSKKNQDKAVFIAESRTVVELALAAGCTPLSFLMDGSQLTGASEDPAGDVLSGKYGDVPLYTGDDEILERLTGFSLSRGVMSVMRRPHLPSTGCTAGR